MRQGLSRINIVSLTLGLTFLYVPMAILVVYSFNASRLVSVWGGWSIRWYAALLNDSPLVDAAWLSLRIAFVSATIAAALGTLAALALVRGGNFRGRSGFGALIYAPIVMPEVITGLALLLLFVAVDFERGFWSVTIAHTTVTMCFAALVVQARLVSFDRSLEDAAIDLGCPPVRTFFAITLPLIWPAVAAAWILAFTLSLDDFVLASFAGSGITTLPIRLYSDVRLGVKPEINAICTLMIAFVALALIAYSLLARRGAHSGRATGPTG